jgi:hypothetical protein
LSVEARGLAHEPLHSDVDRHHPHNNGNKTAKMAKKWQKNGKKWQKM